MNKEIEQLNKDWKSYLKWIVAFPIVLILSIGLEALFASNLLVIFKYLYPSDLITYSAIGILFFMCSATLIGFCFYIYHLINTSNKLFNVLKINKFIAHSWNITTLLIFFSTLISFPTFDVHLKNMLISFILTYVGLSFFLLPMPFFISYKIRKYWKLKQLKYNSIGIIK